MKESEIEGELEWVRKPVGNGLFEETGEVVFISKKGGKFIQSKDEKFADADICSVDDYFNDNINE